MDSAPLRTVLRVTKALEESGLDYAVGGSIASGLYGDTTRHEARAAMAAPASSREASEAGRRPSGGGGARVRAGYLPLPKRLSSALVVPVRKPASGSAVTLSDWGSAAFLRKTAARRFAASFA